MEPVNSLKRPGIAAKLRSSKGFSLIEMAIVLVIIGIIIAAIIKGQDLIVNANAKKAASTATQWRNLAMAFYDRNGRFPGDENKNGVIGDQTTTTDEQTAATSATAEIVGIMEQTPDNPLVLGSTSLYMYFGNVATLSSGNRNAIIICGDLRCANVLAQDQVELVKAVDTAIDGTAGSDAGSVRGFTAATLIPLPPTLVSNRYAATFNGLATVDQSVAGNLTSTWSTTYKGAAWLFDKNF